MKTTAGWAGALVVALSLAAVTTACSRGSRTIEITVRDSRFSPTRITVARGEQVRFQIVNEDPIAHEFILGTHQEQLAHEQGTDLDHDGAPGAASLAIGETAVVDFTFNQDDPLEFACHLPGHFAYGMRGVLDVR